MSKIVIDWPYSGTSYEVVFKEMSALEALRTDLKLNPPDGDSMSAEDKLEANWRITRAVVKDFVESVNGLVPELEENGDVSLGEDRLPILLVRRIALEVYNDATVGKPKEKD